MSDDAERVHGVRFPGADARAPARTPPRATGTLEEILAGIEADTPAARLAHDLNRIERALAALEQALREAHGHATHEARNQS